MLVNVDSHDNDWFIGCRGPQRVAYPSKAGGLQKHTKFVTPIRLGVDFQDDVRQVPDRQVEVITGSVSHSLVIVICVNQKVKRIRQIKRLSHGLGNVNGTT